MATDVVCAQNILYCPFGLRCGHQLCKTCALRCAGMSTMLGDPVKLLAKVSPEAKCPECQQQGMFQDIMYLKQVDQLVKERQVSPVCPSSSAACLSTVALLQSACLCFLFCWLPVYHCSSACLPLPLCNLLVCPWPCAICLSALATV